MKVEFTKAFSKDLDIVSSKSVRLSLMKIIVKMEAAASLEEISNLKKLKGHKTAFRVRVGDYRLGFFLENSTILIGRFLHRKDIYKLFP